MSAQTHTTAVLLVGGLGSRLREVVDDRPKPLASVCGRPFLSYLLEQVRAGGFTRAVLCTGYRGEMIEAHFGADYRGMKLIYSHEQTPLGTGGALRAALPLLCGERALVVNGDSYCEVDLGRFQAEHEASGAKAGMVLTLVADTARYGRVEHHAGRVRSFQEKTSPPGQGPDQGPDQGPEWINAGIYLFDPDLLAHLAGSPTSPRAPLSLERDLFPRWVDDPGLFAFLAHGRFIDIGTPRSYRDAQEFFAAQRHE